MTKNKISIYFLFIALLGVLGCKNNVFYTNNVDFLNEHWHKDSAINFEVEINDTNQVYHVFFNTRITGQYEHSNLFLFIDTEIPNLDPIRDTLECILAKPSGEWLGKGFGNICSNKIAFRKYVKFPYSGIYKFRIEQAMRVDNLPYVLDAGITIEEAKK